MVDASSANASDLLCNCRDGKSVDPQDGPRPGSFLCLDRRRQPTSIRAFFATSRDSLLNAVLARQHRRLHGLRPGRQRRIFSATSCRNELGWWRRSSRASASACFHAAKSLLEAGHETMCLLNSDSPTLPIAYLLSCRHRPAAPGDRIVLGPSTDGGYYLLGLKRPHRRLFEDIDWSTEKGILTDQVTRAGAEPTGVRAAVLVRCR